MTAWTEAWRRLLKLWVPPLVLVLLGLGTLAFYRLNYAGESAGLENRLQAREALLAKEKAERQRLEGLLAAAQATESQVEALYRDRFSTRRQRLTQATEEVKSLARRAGLEIESINYPEEEIESFALVQRSFVFTVRGSYRELRTLINFLELSPSFLTLKTVTLRGGKSNDDEVTMDLTLETLFARSEASPLSARATS